METYPVNFKINDPILRLVKNIETILTSNKIFNNDSISSVYSSCHIEGNKLSLKQVKSIYNNQIVLGDHKEILEIKNAFNAYSHIKEFKSFDVNSLLKAHKYITKDIISDAGKFRNNNEGVFDGDKCIFIAPPPHMVPSLIKQLFDWLKDYKDLSLLILSCIFHYEFIFLHPFKDGNGRTARLWQKVILGKYNPIFYYLPIERYILNSQQEYYSVINACNKDGESTKFIEYMLNIIFKALKEQCD